MVPQRFKAGDMYQSVLLLPSSNILVAILVG